MFLGGAMRIDADLARNAIEPLAGAMNKSVMDAALGIVHRVVTHTAINHTAIDRD